MTKFLPIFPLATIVYPGQYLNLHIFEPRYKQLITECRDEKKTFGIPSVYKDTLNEFGTEMELLEVTHIHENGEMDIKTRGAGIFRIMEVIRDVPDKLYSAAIVYQIPEKKPDTAVPNPTLIDLINKLHTVLGTGFKVEDKFKSPLSYDLVQYAAVSPEDQYRLLTAESEIGRQWFLIEHLKKLIPSVEETERVKAKVQMNGHFRKEIPPAF